MDSYLFEAVIRVLRLPGRQAAKFDTLTVLAFYVVLADRAETWLRYRKD
jgi:hypothetical protein